MSLFDMKGKVAVITGSTKGIGLAIAERMAEHGAKVVISSRKADVCDKVAERHQRQVRQGDGGCDRRQHLLEGKFAEPRR